MKTLPEILEQFHEYTSIKLTHSDKDSCVSKITPAIAKELMRCLPEKLAETNPESSYDRLTLKYANGRELTADELKEAKVSAQAYNQAISEVRARLTAFIGRERNEDTYSL